MATKVMLAPAIAQRAVNPTPTQRSGASAEARPKRRRSSVYDADGNEVFITLMCLKCHQMRPLSQFGLRRMADGAIRNQPWCRACRAGASGEAPRGQRGGRDRRAGKLPAPEEPSTAQATTIETIIDPGTLAAQVVAALNGGRR